MKIEVFRKIKNGFLRKKKESTLKKYKKHKELNCEEENNFSREEKEDNGNEMVFLEANKLRSKKIMFRISRINEQKFCFDVNKKKK